jgi:hypothetical protein
MPTLVNATVAKHIAKERERQQRDDNSNLPDGDHARYSPDGDIAPAE